MDIRTLISNKDVLKSYKSRDVISLDCDYCGNVFGRKKNDIQWEISKGTTTAFCSRRCRDDGNISLIQCVCYVCDKEFTRIPSQVKPSRKLFCSQSCAAYHNNKNKTYGTRRSKLERWLEKTIPTYLPNLEIVYNSKTAIGSELDIYIPSLSLAFEINGIYHFKPIHGEEKLAKILAMDKEKADRCLERGIKLIPINTSSQRKFTEESSMKYLNIILDSIKTESGAGLVL